MRKQRLRRCLAGVLALAVLLGGVLGCGSGGTVRHTGKMPEGRFPQDPRKKG